MDTSQPPPFVVGDETNPDTCKLNEFAPEIPGRAFVIGASGSGKTRMISNLLTRFWSFMYLFVHAKFIHKKDYTGLRSYFEKQEQKLGTQMSQWSDNLDDLPDINDLDEDTRSVIITDDMMNESKTNQKKIGNMFIAGRKGGCMVICIAQSFTGLSKDGRRNITDIFMFGGSPPIDADSLEAIWKNYCRDIPTKAQFIALYDSCIAIPFGYLYIDLRAPDIYRKYRFKFDNFFDPSTLIIKKK